ncbi:MAG TPA: WXG100 family type VII secretion target, partial [Pseudonocardiaceae bacterium]|nr:WXG100 family type VII secretion target [Pseudonocardiaceae bacterium]
SAGTVSTADAERAVTGAGPALDYLSRTARHLGVPDPVQEYFGPVVGRWRDLHEQAQRWQRAANAVEELADRVTTPLGGLDAAWEGAVADSFLEHMRQVGAAGRGLSDAMTVMAEVLDRTADAVQRLVTDLVELLSGGADRVSAAMILPAGGEQLAGRQLAEVRGCGRRVFEAVRDVLDAFVELCDDLDAGEPFAEVRVATPFPQQAWSWRTDVPQPPELQPPGQPADRPPPEQAPAAGTGSSGLALGAGGAAPAGGAAAAPPAQPAEPAMRTLAAEPIRPEPTLPAATGGSAAAAGGQGAGARGAAAVPFMPMAMGGAGAGQDNEHRTKSRIVADPSELFGKPTRTAPPVIGED